MALSVNNGDRSRDGPLTGGLLEEQPGTKHRFSVTPFKIPAGKLDSRKWQKVAGPLPLRSEQGRDTKREAVDASSGTPRRQDLGADPPPVVVSLGNAPAQNSAHTAAIAGVFGASGWLLTKGASFTPPAGEATSIWPGLH